MAPDFALSDAKDQQIHLAERLAEEPVVVSFYRGAWCPFCNVELPALQSALPKISELGGARRYHLSPGLTRLRLLGR